jgi:acetyltransferase
MLDALFKPGSVAVIGASTKELSIGNRIVKNLIDFGYKGSIYPVNPMADEIRGIKAYGSILDVPGDVDLVHIVIPNKFVLQAIEDCGKKGVKVAIVNTAGFKEIGEAGIELEAQLVEKAKNYGIRIFGPNCQGIINTDPEVRAYCNFTFTMPVDGGISIVAQSGGVGEVINQRFSELGVGVRMYASNGNASDISIPEIIRYWGEDERTRVIVVHIENLADPKEFVKTAREVAAKKPILGMKTGRTREGAKAVSSHTGGLAKVDIATELIFKKCGILTFRDEEELCQAAVAFATQPIPSGGNVGMITNTGGPAIIAVDELVEAGLNLPPLSKESAETLKGKLYPEASVDNPVDVLATGRAEHFRAALDVLMAQADIDSILVNFVTPFFVDVNPIAKELVDVSRSQSKPIICNLMTDSEQWAETLNILKDGGVPCYSFPETAARALVSMKRFHDLKDRNIGKVKAFADVDKMRVQDIIRKAKKESRNSLRADEVYEILKAYRIPVAEWRVATDGEQARESAREIGFPVAVKVDSEKIEHKSDAGGVALNVFRNKIESVVKEMESKFSDEKPRFLIQKQLPAGIELIVGAKREENLGHLIMFGLGGIHVEVLKDVSFVVTPVTEVEANEVISSIKSYPLLTGFRGGMKVDMKMINELIQRASQLVTDSPQISEMDLNPIIAYEKDARVGPESDNRVREGRARS